MLSKFHIANHALELSNAEVKLDEDGCLSIQVTSKPHGIVNEELFDDYYESVDLQFSRIPIQYFEGPPHLQFTLPIIGISDYLYGLKSGTFYGTIAVGPNSLRIDGRGYHRFMKPQDYEILGDPDPSTPIHIELDLNIEFSVDWTRHRFTSLEEARLAPAEVVTNLVVATDSLGIQFPEEIFRYTNLRELRLGEIFDQNDWTQLPNRIGEFKQLRGLYLFGARNLHSLPAELGELSELEDFYAVNCGIRTIPRALVQLPKLTSLSLSGNALTEFPVPSSPLERLELQNNQLTTLPAEVGQLAALRNLAIYKNPLESLPSLSNVKDVDIETEKIKLYRDIRYPSRNPNPIDPSLFLLTDDPQLTEQLQAQLQKYPTLQPHAAAILKQARRAIFLETFEVQEPPSLGMTRFGGWPDLPASVEYPRDEEDGLYTFMAQLNLAELAPLQNYLPRQGWLYFFMADDQEIEGPVVIYHPGPIQELVPYLASPDHKFSNYDRDEPYPSYPASPRLSWSLPNIYASHSYGAGRFGDDLHHFEALDEVAHQMTPDPYSSLAHPEEKVHSINAFVFTQHESPEEQAAKLKLGEADEWMNLLSIDADPRVGFCFWDAGTLTFTVHKKDLAIADFSNVCISLESS